MNVFDMERRLWDIQGELNSAWDYRKHMEHTLVTLRKYPERNEHQIKRHEMWLQETINDIERLKAEKARLEAKLARERAKQQ